MEFLVANCLYFLVAAFVLAGTTTVITIIRARRHVTDTFQTGVEEMGKLSDDSNLADVGMGFGKYPAFSKQYVDLKSQAIEAITNYITEVKDNTFPL